MEERIFREYDIRGVFGKDLTEETSYYVGKALVTLINRETGRRPKVLSVGIDARLSSEKLKSSLIDGITETGTDVLDLGLCPTPLQYFSLHRLELDGGVMVTGSHNPPEYNGFKLSIGKETIYGEKIVKLKEIIEKGDFIVSERKGTVTSYDIVSEYQQFMERHFNSLEGIKVVLDSGNGTVGVVAPKIFRSLGAEVVELFSEPDGRFPNHHPDPVIPENLITLRDTTVSTRAHFGVGFDGDGDRIGVIDEEGEIVWGDRLMILFAKDILERVPKAKIIGEVKCSKIMYEEIERLGGCPIMWKTGHSLIKDKMKKEGALLAGEMSGHIFFADRYFGFDDAIYASLRLAEIVKRAGKPYGIKRHLEGLSKTYSTPEIRVTCPDDRKFLVIEKFKEYFRDSDCCTIDGLRVNLGRGWALIRASNTQPALVLRFEAQDEEELERIKNDFHQKLFEVFNFFKLL